MWHSVWRTPHYCEVIAMTTHTRSFLPNCSNWQFPWPTQKFEGSKSYCSRAIINTFSMVTYHALCSRKFVRAYKCLWQFFACSTVVRSWPRDFSLKRGHGWLTSQWELVNLVLPQSSAHFTPMHGCIQGCPVVTVVPKVATYGSLWYHKGFLNSLHPIAPICAHSIRSRIACTKY